MKTKARPTERISTTPGTDPRLARILAVFAEFEREQRSKVMKAAMQRKRARQN